MPLLYERHLRGKVLVRLEGLLAQVGVELAQLGRMAHITLIRGLGVFGLYLERFVRRFGAQQFFHRLSTVLPKIRRPRLLRLDPDVLREMAERTKLANELSARTDSHRRFETFFTADELIPSLFGKPLLSDK
jgi:hypothetical protein